MPKLFIHPLTIDLSSSLGYGLYYIAFIRDGSAPASFAEEFYSLHRRSLRCKIYENKGIFCEE